MTSKMNTWLYKYKGMQALRTEDDDDSEASLPMFLEEEKKKNKTTTTTASSWPWVPLACTLLLAASALSFHLRWSPHGAPLDLLQLPPRPYTFVDHPEMRPFDQATSDVWLPWGRDHWWSMEWRDPASGARLTQGIDMLHKLHCLVSIRDEFTLMATDQDRRVFFNDRTAESVTRRMHIKHCFDFIRGVRCFFIFFLFRETRRQADWFCYLKKNYRIFYVRQTRRLSPWI